MNHGEILENELIEGFVQAVNGVPGIHVARECIPSNRKGPDRGIDGLAKLWTADNRPETTLLIEVKRSLFPRDLPQIVWTVRKYQQNLHQGRQLIVLLADTISNGAKDWMQAEGVGYYDSSGSLFLPTDGAYILIERPPTKKQVKTVGSVFEGRRSLVIEALWFFRDHGVRVKDIAERIDASPSMVSETLTELARRDWVMTEGTGPAKLRQLANWASLLDEWTRHETSKGERDIERYYVSNSRPETLAERLDEACNNRKIAYEITGEWAGNQYTPHLSSVSQLKVRMTDAGVRDLVIHALGAKRVNEGWNLALIPYGPGEETTFADRETSISLASPLRTYLDLLRSGGRAKELAKELRAQWLTL